MYKQFYSAMESTALPVFALWFFIAGFVAITGWLFLFKKKSDFQGDALMPLNDGTVSSNEVKP